MPLKEVDIRDVVRKHITKKYGTQRAAAKAWNVTPNYVSMVLNGSRVMPDFMANEAGYEIVQAVAEWIKIKKEK